MASLPTRNIEGDSGQFCYQPLIGDNSIRLLILQPGIPGSIIHCDLIHTTLADCRDDIYDHYTALSYVWGDAKQSRRIFIEGKSAEGTISLAAALDGLRHESKILRLWADAICIDQSNIQERNEQVSLMRWIYTLAQQTIIYLGTSNEDCDRLLEAIAKGQSSDEVRKLANTEILSRDWFTRVWTYQELVLAKEVWVQCGRRRVKWDSLFTVLPTNLYRTQQLLMKDHEPRAGETEVGMEMLLGMQRTRLKLRLGVLTGGNSDPESLLQILLARRGFGVTDLRDMIYGHLALAIIDPSSEVIEIDYEKTVIEVFGDTTSDILRTEGHKVFFHAELMEPEGRMKDLPSWIPDWSLRSSQYIRPISLPILSGEKEDCVIRGINIKSSTVYAFEGMDWDVFQKVEEVTAIISADSSEIHIEDELATMGSIKFSSGEPEGPWSSAAESALRKELITLCTYTLGASPPNTKFPYFKLDRKTAYIRLFVLLLSRGVEANVEHH
jgi:hypothetical protein